MKKSSFCPKCFENYLIIRILQNNFGVKFIMNKRPKMRYNDDDDLQDDIDDIDDEDLPNEVSFKDLSNLSEACLIRILRMCEPHFSYFFKDYDNTDDQ